MTLNDALIARFVNYSSLEKRNSSKWVREQLRHLRWLASRLRGQDLIDCPLKVLHPLVVGNPHRAATLKALYGYLRKVTYELKASQDPTFRCLLVPQRCPSHVDKSVQLSQVNRAILRLGEPWRSRLLLQARTGIHTTELQRFAKEGKVVPYSGQPGAVAYLTFAHKSGEAHHVALDRKLRAAARKVLQAGPFTAEFYHKHVKEAGGFTPGRLRHTVATQLVNQGVQMGVVATFLGHRSPVTTRRWYAKFAVPHNPMLGAKRGRRR